MKTNFENFEFFTKYFGENAYILGEMTKFQTLSDYDNVWYPSIIFDVEFNNEEQF